MPWTFSESRLCLRDVPVSCLPKYEAAETYLALIFYALRKMEEKAFIKMMLFSRIWSSF